MPRVLLLGATGLVGRHCLRLLLDEPGVSRVVTLTRRPLGVGTDAGAAATLDAHIVDFEELAGHAPLFAVDAIICALGTTIKAAGSERAFRRVDFDYPLEAARLGVAHGARHFLLVSSLGADATSRFFYNRVKGELEQAVLALPYEGVTIVRPSLLLGDRSEFRPGEAIAKRLGWLMPGKYRPVAARAVATVLVRAAADAPRGARIIESGEIRRLTGN